MQLRIDHVALAVKDYAAARAFFEKVFGALPGAGAPDRRLGFHWQVFSLGDLSRLELIAPLAAKSFLEGFLRKREGGLHHITFHTDDIHAVKAHLDRCKVPYFGFSDTDPNWKELFIHPRDAFGVLIQVAAFDPDAILGPEARLGPEKRWALVATLDGCRLLMAHPGGGKVALDLSPEEIDALIADLQQHKTFKSP
jgi:methylmalonyl-CoA/ethylmalonyl-CoA epimerase